MVSVHPNQAHQDFDYNFCLDPTKMKMALPGLKYLPSQQQPPPTLSTTSISGKTPAEIAEDPNKKVRKAYTISRSRESWTEQEHDKFLEALHLFDRDWKKIEAFVGSKTVIQIRSHAQKYFLKVQKNGRNEHVPPPRPKRKAVHPYPQKAYKNAPAASLVAGPIQSSTAMLEPEYLHWPDSSSVLHNPTPSATLSSWMCNSGPAVNILHDTKDNVNLAKQAKACHSCYSSSNDSTLRSWTNIAGCNQGNQTMPVRVMPDFAQVYSFIGSVFDPNATEHLERLKKMDPINLKTVLLLMRNLSINLTSPEFEDHRRFLSSFDGESGEVKGSSFYSNFHANKPRVAIPSA